MSQPSIYSKDIIYFQKCADLKSLSKAAQELNLSQSALSTSLQRLERDLGFELFIRGRGLGAMKLTSGAEKLIQHLKNQEQSVKSLFAPKQQAPSLKIAAIQYVSRKYLLPALESVRLLDDARVFTVRSAKALEAIKADRIDMALILGHGRPIRDARYCIEIKQEVVGYVGLRSRFPMLAKAKSFDDLKSLPLIVGDRIREDWYDCLNDYRRAYYIEDHFSARMLVLGGYAIAPFQLDYFTDDELKLLAVSKFNFPSTGMKLYAVFNRRSSPQVIEQCRSIASEIIDVIDKE